MTISREVVQVVQVTHQNWVARCSFPRSLTEAFKNNIYYDSLLLLFDGLGKEKGQIYGLGRQTSFIYRGKKSETSGDSLYHLIIYSAHSQ